MAGKTLPLAGEAYSGNPAGLRVAKVKFGRSSADDVQLATTATQTKMLFTVPAGCLVHDVMVATLSSLVAGAGNSGVMKIGDSNTNSGYFVSSDIRAKGTASASIKARTFKNGKYYAAAQAINLYGSVLAPTAGEAEIFLIYSMAHNDL